MNVMSLPDEMLASFAKYMDPTDRAKIGNKRFQSVMKRFKLDGLDLKRFSTDDSCSICFKIDRHDNDGIILYDGNVKTKGKLDAFEKALKKIARVDTLSLRSFNVNEEVLEIISRNAKILRNRSLELIVCTLAADFTFETFMDHANRLRLSSLTIAGFPDVKNLSGKVLAGFHHSINITVAGAGPTKITTAGLQNRVFARHYRNLQPICCGSKMFFRLSEDFEFTQTFDRAYPLPNVYFTVDLDSLQLNAEIPTWIGMADDSLGILNIPCSSFTPEMNRFSHYSWNNEQFIVNWYEFDDSCVDEVDELRECEVFITDVLNSTIAKSSVQMKWSDWLTLHPSGALFHWNHEKGLLQCLNKPRPLVRPPSLFELAKQRLLMTRAHEQDDKFINWLLFDV